MNEQELMLQDDLDVNPDTLVVDVADLIEQDASE